MPEDAVFLGVRLVLGTVLANLPVQGLVDRFVELPVHGRAFRLGGDSVRIPRHDESEDFIALLVRRGLLVSGFVDDSDLSSRTRQRRYLSAVGLPQRTVLQIERARQAAVRLREGQAPSVVAQECGFFDQPHLARSLRRFIGPSASELARDPETTRPLSLLYKTEGNTRR